MALRPKLLAFSLTGLLAIGLVGGATAAFADGPGRDGPRAAAGAERHRPHHPIRLTLKQMAETCGLTREDLKAGAEAGQTIAEVLEANGTDPAQCKADLLAKLDARLTTAVEEGKITEERKATALEKAGNVIDRLLAHVLGSNRPATTE